MKRLLSFVLLITLVFNGVSGLNIAFAEEASSRTGTADETSATEWFGETVEYTGGVVAHEKPDIMLMLLDELEVAYVTLDGSGLEVGKEAVWEVTAEGGAEPYSFYYALFWQAMDDTGNSYSFVSGSGLSTDSNRYSFEIPYEGRYLLQFKITDATGEYIVFQSNIYETPTDELQAKVLEIVAECAYDGLSDYQKALNLHDWLCDNAEYDYSYTIYEPYGVLLEGTGVCQSFALAYQMLLTEAGVENVYVEGSSMGESHAWNMVKLGGDWYHVDVTWDEDGNDRFYFGLSTALIERDHVIDSRVPEAAATAYNYVLRNSDGAFSSLDELGALINALPEGQDTFRFYYMGNEQISAEYMDWCYENRYTYCLTDYSCTSSEYTHYVEGTVYRPDLDVHSAEFDSSMGYAGTPVGIAVTTSFDACYLHMYGEGGALIKTWDMAWNVSDSGDVRTWNVDYTFSSAGERKMTFKASSDGVNMGEGRTAVITVASGAPAVGRAEFGKSIAAKGETVNITVTTNSDATQLIMYSEGGGKVKTWAADGNSAVSGGMRVWNVSYAFVSAGNRTLTFKASRDGGATVGKAKTAGIKVVEAKVTSAAFNSSIGYVNAATGMTVKTNADMKYLHMYAENGALVKTWAADGNSGVSGSVRTWNISYVFGGAGSRTMTFRTSVDGEYKSAGVSAKVLLASGAPAVGQVLFSKKIAAKGETVTITVKTNSDATQLIMYSEGGGKVKTWAADGNSSVSGTVRVWKVTYAFGGAGNRTITFKASRDGGKTVGKGNSAGIQVISANVTSAKFNSSIGYVKNAMGITVQTHADVKYLYMYGEGGALIKKWDASGNSSVSGSVRTWNVSYAFSSAGNRKMTFKGSIDGAYTGTGMTASVLVASGAPAVGQVLFSSKTAAKGETVTITVKTNSDATQLAMYSEDGSKVKTWNADGNSGVSGSVRVWKVMYAFGGAGNRRITFRASRDGGKTMGAGNTASINIK